jgi:hypothetical protein
MIDTITYRALDDGSSSSDADNACGVHHHVSTSKRIFVYMLDRKRIQPRGESIYDSAFAQDPIRKGSPGAV